MSSAAVGSLVTQWVPLGRLQKHGGRFVYRRISLYNLRKSLHGPFLHCRAGWQRGNFLPRSCFQRRGWTVNRPTMLQGNISSKEARRARREGDSARRGHGVRLLCGRWSEGLQEDICQRPEKWAELWIWAGGALRTALRWDCASWVWRGMAGEEDHLTQLEHSKTAEYSADSLQLHHPNQTVWRRLKPCPCPLGGFELPTWPEFTVKSSWLWTWSDPPAFAPGMLVLQVCTTTPGCFWVWTAGWARDSPLCHCPAGD